MHFRRNTALALGAVLLATPALTSCGGFTYATDREYTPAVGANNRDASVDVLGAVIVSGQENSGTFIASFANNSQQDEASFESVAGAEGNTLQPGAFSPVTIPAGGLVNLAIEGGVPVSGEFVAGNFVPITIELGSGERVTMDVPVVEDAGDFEGLDTSGGASSTETPSESPTESPAESPSESPTE